ncbi:MAG: YesL family protein [Agathobacter sp.]
MIDMIFNAEGPVFRFLGKLGQMVVLSVLWMIGCIPIVTIATSTTAFYYTTIKVVRREHGTVVGEFWSSYKTNLKRGILTTVAILLPGSILALNIYLLQKSEIQNENTLFVGYILGAILLAAVCMYVCPVLSRFSVNVVSAWKLAFIMAIRFLPITLILLIGTVLSALIQFYILPMAAILITPAIWCYLATYLVEKVLLKYMPEKSETDDAWYYE